VWSLPAKNTACHTQEADRSAAKIKNNEQLIYYYEDEQWIHMFLISSIL